MHSFRTVLKTILAPAALCATITGAGNVWDGTLVQYGTMREAIGQQKSEGRVELSTLTSRPHFYGIAALENLEGEITIFDSTPTVTTVGDQRVLAPLDAPALRATLLAGAYVPSWRERTLDSATPADRLDRVVRDAAAAAGVDTAKPFVFAAEGEFTDVRLHVINGACPMHARMRGVALPEEMQPFEAEFAALHGKLVGIYAEDAAGKLTHPDTSTHIHLIYTDESTGQTVTGHVERIGLAAGAIVKLP
jgi:alpha-acetolactate decarboxylase